MYERCDNCGQIMQPQLEARESAVDRQNWSVDVGDYGRELRSSLDPEEMEEAASEHQCFGLGIEVGRLSFGRLYRPLNDDAGQPLWMVHPCSTVVAR
jgi:hypothetical protein